MLFSTFAGSLLQEEPNPDSLSGSPGSLGYEIVMRSHVPCERLGYILSIVRNLKVSRTSSSSPQNSEYSTAMIVVPTKVEPPLEHFKMTVSHCLLFFVIYKILTYESAT